MTNEKTVLNFKANIKIIYKDGTTENLDDFSDTFLDAIENEVWCLLNSRELYQQEQNDREQVQA